VSLELSLFRIKSHRSLEEFFSNRYDDRFQLVVGKLRTLALRPPKSTTVEVIQKEILEIIQEEEPGSSLPLPTAQEPHPESISSSIVLASNNPFLPRKRKTDPQALEPSPSLSFQSQVTDETTAFLPSPSAGHSFSTPGSQHWSQERPCDKWYREHQEAQRATTSTAASPGLLEQQSQHGSLYTIRHDERSQDAVMSAYQMSHNWPTNSSFQPASVTLGCLGTNEGDLNSTSPSFYRGAQSQPISQYHNYPIHDHIEDTRLGWPLSSTSTMPGLWNN
jgi:hypothetical protein